MQNALHSRIVRQLCALTLLACAGRADQITLTNGDTLTGTLIKKDGAKVTLKSEFLGEVTFPWAAVKSLKSDNPLFVVLEGGKEVSGRLSTAGADVEVATPSTPVITPLAQVAAIRDEAEQRKYERLLAPGWLELWAGYFDIGVSLARGNARTSTVATSSEALRLTRTDKTRLYFKQIYANARLNGIGIGTANAVRGGWAYDHNLSPRLFFNVFNDYETDRFLRLDLRFVAGGGLGYHAVKSERITLDFLGGSSYNRENFSNSIVRNSAEAYWGNDLAYKLNGTTSLTQTFRMFNNLTRGGDYRVNFDFGTATTLRRWLSFQLTASDRFLSNPVLGRQRNDILLTTGLRVGFAR